MKIRFRSDRETWVLDLGFVEGRRRQFSFPSKKEAEAAAKAYSANATPIELLSPMDARRFAVAARRLEEVGASDRKSVV
jgi:hypothetical protein